jgi:glyoxylase-like metal-dependent hydrolase (beta-lactamase superfamily II)
VVLRIGDTHGPLPLVVRSWPAAETAHALLHAGRRGLHELVEALRWTAIEERVWTALDPDRRTLFDVDEPGDLPDERPVGGHPAHHGGPIRIGGTEVEVVCEGWAPLPLSQELPGRAVDWPAELDRFPWLDGGLGAWAWHVHAFVLRGPFSLVLVDTGLGAFPPYAPWGAAAVADPWVSLDPAEVATVVITHLHADHAGGGVVGGEPRFPNARYVVHRADWDAFASVDDQREYVARHALEAAGDALDLDPADREVAPGVRVMHTPGHTPGHRSVLVGDDLFVTGDLLHLPTQAAHPDWASSHDDDPARACVSRSALLQRARNAGWTIAVNHFTHPFGRVGPSGWISLPGPDPVG